MEDCLAMFSFHKTLFPYLRQAHDYQTKQASSSTFLQTCTCIYIFKNAYGLQQIQCTQVKHLGYKKHHLVGPKRCRIVLFRALSGVRVYHSISYHSLSHSVFDPWPFYSSHVDTQMYYTKLILFYSVS